VGGAITAVGSRASTVALFQDCEFEDNQSETSEGGAIYIGVQWRVENSQFISNVAAEGGGAISSKVGSLHSNFVCTTIFSNHFQT
jgi:predicted outer membrane repeat protein